MTKPGAHKPPTTCFFPIVHITLPLPTCLQTAPLYIPLHSLSQTLIPLTSTQVCEMCPLRLILMFLSATLAGFFVFRNLRSQPHHPTELDRDDKDTDTAQSSDSANASLKIATSKVRAALESGYWTFVDMSSGRYLWRQLVSST